MHDGPTFNRDLNARESAESVVVEDMGNLNMPSHPPLETSGSRGVEVNDAKLY